MSTTAPAPDATTQPVGTPTTSPIQDAAKRRLKLKGKRFGDYKKLQKKNKPIKGKYAGKERYKGLTKNAPKGKYKGKYIGPDRFKGDAKAINDWKAGKRKKRFDEHRKILKKLPVKKPVTTQPVGKPVVAPNNPPISVAPDPGTSSGSGNTYTKP